MPHRSDPLEGRRGAENICAEEELGCSAPAWVFKTQPRWVGLPACSALPWQLWWVGAGVVGYRARKRGASRCDPGMLVDPRIVGQVCVELSGPVTARGGVIKLGDPVSPFLPGVWGAGAFCALYVPGFLEEPPGNSPWLLFHLNISFGSSKLEWEE